jgi:hypothetical protein
MTWKKNIFIYINDFTVTVTTTVETVRNGMEQSVTVSAKKERFTVILRV